VQQKVDRLVPPLALRPKLGAQGKGETVR